MIKKVLTIAGSDSGGGAGIQADLKAFENMGVFGMSVITAVTAQNTRGVTGVYQLPAEFVAKQIDAVISDLGADAVKIGMLGSAQVVKIVAEKINYYRLENVVLDPVIVSTSGDKLLEDEAIRFLKKHLIPCARIITPNRHETEILSGLDLAVEENYREAARIIYGLGPGGVLVKGGDLASRKATDLYYDGEEFHSFSVEKINTTHTHGTGCTLSSVMAACLARGMSPVSAIKTAKQYVYRKIKMAHQNPLGHGNSPISLPAN